MLKTSFNNELTMESINDVSGSSDVLSPSPSRDELTEPRTTHNCLFTVDTPSITNSLECPGHHCPQNGFLPTTLYVRCASGLFHLSPFFCQTILESSSPEWLLLLKREWRHHGTFLQRHEDRTGPLRAEICQMKVLCLNHERIPLENACLPLRGWTAGRATVLPFLDIPDGNDEFWDFLISFGVTTKQGAKFSIRWLKKIRNQRLQIQDVPKLYEQLQTTDDAERDVIRQAFRDYALVYIPGSGDRWVMPEECVWRGPDSLIHSPRLAEIYPNYEELFCNILGVHNATPLDLLCDSLVPKSIGPLDLVDLRLNHASIHHVERVLRSRGYYKTTRFSQSRVRNATLTTRPRLQTGVDMDASDMMYSPLLCNASYNEYAPPSFTHAAEASSSVFYETTSIDSPVSQDSEIIRQDQSLGRSGLPERSLRNYIRNTALCRTDPADVVYLTDDVNPNSNGMNWGPARIYTNDQGRHTVVVKNESQTQSEVSFHGEVFVSSLLQQLQGGSYHPNRAWTSRLRVESGHGPFLRDPVATFEISNPSDDLLQYIRQFSYYNSPDWLNQSTICYFDVHATIDDLNSPFVLSSTKFEKLEEVSKEAESNNAVYILIRLFQVKSKPQMVMIVDPWGMHATHQFRVFMRDGILQGALQPSLLLQNRTFSCEAMTPEAQYTYKRLYNDRMIRLLELDYDPSNDGIVSGNVIEVSLDNLPCKYTALSYSWGSSLKPYTFHTPHGVVPITVSLYMALLDVLKHKVSTRYLWVDAISINQADEHEKAAQIELVPRIFNSAVGMLAWIGGDQSHNTSAIDSILAVSQKAQCAHPRRSRSRLRCPTPRAQFSLEQVNWTAVNEFLERPWFQRSWIVQEIVFAKTVTIMCGNKTLEWDDLHRAMEAYSIHARISLSKLEIPTIRNSNAILNLSRHRAEYKLSSVPQHSLLSLFSAFHHTQASLPRDKLFALRNVAIEVNDADFQPDYTSSMPVVLCKYAAGFVRRGHAFDMLYRAGAHVEPTEIPSWIPDWTSSPYPRTISTWNTVKGKFHAAGRTTLNAMVHPKDDGVLSITGYIVDTVTTVGTNCSSKNILIYLDEIFHTIRSLQSYSTGNLEDILWKLAIGDAREPPDGIWETNDFYLSFKHLQRYLHLYKESKLFSLPSEELNALKHALWLYICTAIYFSECIGSAVVAVTEKGYVGLVPEHTRPRDQLAIFSGGSVPFILRRSDRGDRYWLLGECYFHGLMQGHAVKNAKDREIHLY